MTARLYSIQMERCRRIRAKGGSERDYQRTFERVGHASIMAFEQSLRNRESVCEFSTVESYFGSHFSNLSANTLQGAAVYMSAFAAATAMAALILRETERLLTHASSLLTAKTNLGSRSRACLRDDGAKLR